MRGVIGYRHGRVFVTREHTYRVGRLPAGWERMRAPARTISFYNRTSRSSISTDAMCGRDVSDRKLDVLAGGMLSALENRVIRDESRFDLDGRGALRQRMRGSLDGVPVDVDFVVVRKNGCVFDFYAVSPVGTDAQVEEDFEIFFRAFHDK